MNIKEFLIRDIEIFLPQARDLFNRSRIVKKSDYLSLATRISALTIEDFESEEKFNYFMNYVNQDQRRADRYVLEQLFREDYLDDGPFLWMCNYLMGIVNWLK
jgi:hypothetical protein